LLPQNGIVAENVDYRSQWSSPCGVGVSVSKPRRGQVSMFSTTNTAIGLLSFGHGLHTHSSV